MPVSKPEEDRRGMKLVGSLWILEQPLYILPPSRDEHMGPVLRDCHGIVMVKIALKVTVTRSVHDKSITQPVVLAETPSSWIIAVILAASVCAAFLLLLGCIALVWCIYVKTKYAFSPGNVLPQHLKEVGGRLEPEVDEKTLTGRAFLYVRSAQVSTASFPGEWHTCCLLVHPPMPISGKSVVTEQL